jgi:hypothetical protein
LITADDRTVRTPVAFVAGSRLATADDIAMFRIRVTMALKSSEDTARRVADRRRKTAEAGYWGGGVRPYAYTPDPAAPTGSKTLVIKSDEADEIRNLAAQILGGVSLRQVSADLRARQVPTVTRTQWTANTVRDVVIKPTTAGRVVDRGAEIGKAKWPAILPEDQWRALVTLLTDPSRLTTDRGNVPRHLLSTIAKCGVCADLVRASGGGPGRPRSYVCRSHWHVRRKAEAD